ncbi:AAA family ATPase [Caldibacillus lycopersici]|uniref:AAA family ATPase n=1 Tax=Perspicuibacillus lycopersici TaxID=1325689 RepID=A0AAE3IVA0_9BACI|nr:AAA family ATPase [Perspicuibacillus lycopersici]MCU9613529.1 AAA family ATPase [Perspicuibacillus lycopersici]
MRMNYYVITEKQMYATAIKSLLDEIKRNNKLFETVYDLKTNLVDSKGTVVIIGPMIGQDPYQICQEISHHYPATAVLLLLKKEAIDYKKAMFSGAIDVLDIECDEADIIESVEKAEAVVRLKMDNTGLKDDAQKGKIITVCSTKGGVGKTTISVNLATAFNKQNLKVAVVDLDLQFGDVALLFDIQPSQSIYDWVKQSFENGDRSTERFLSKHKSGIDILAAPALPEFAELINGEHISYLCERLKQEYDVIIVDTPPAFVETSLVALENSDWILLIASLDLPALKNGKLAVDTLSLLGLKEQIHVIINRDSEVEGISKEMVEDVLGMKVTGSIPSDYRTVISSINKGEPFVTLMPRTAVAKAVLAITDQLINGIPKKSEVKKKHRLFSLKKNKE